MQMKKKVLALEGMRFGNKACTTGPLLKLAKMPIANIVPSWLQNVCALEPFTIQSKSC